MKEIRIILCYNEFILCPRYFGGNDTFDFLTNRNQTILLSCYFKI